MKCSSREIRTYLYSLYSLSPYSLYNVFNIKNDLLVLQYNLCYSLNKRLKLDKPNIFCPRGLYLYLSGLKISLTS